MKKIEEVTKEFSEKSVWACPISFKAGVEFAQRWISVEDELPEVKNHGFSDLVLTKNSYDNIMLERYDSESKQFNGIRYGCIKNNDGQVTHWRPIELK